MSKKKHRNAQPNSHDMDLELDPESMPGSEGGVTDEETMQARGSDMPPQEQENDESVQRKRIANAEGGMDEERAA